MKKIINIFIIMAILCSSLFIITSGAFLSNDWHPATNNLSKPFFDQPENICMKLNMSAGGKKIINTSLCDCNMSEGPFIMVFSK
jgi:hypothetical protein